MKVKVKSMPVRYGGKDYKSDSILTIKQDSYKESLFKCLDKSDDGGETDEQSDETGSGDAKQAEKWPA